MEPHKNQTADRPGAVLRRLRIDLGLTLSEMAARLGVGLPAYQAWEYRRAGRVPAAVLDRARNLTIDPEYSYVRAMYGGRPMPDIAREWAQRMGVDENSPAAIAEALGINKSTTSRWLSPDADVRLSSDELLRYERRVRIEEKFYQHSRRRHARIEAANGGKEKV